MPVANEFPNAYVTSTDLSPKSVSLVLKHAQAEDVTNLTAQAADAQNLVDFADSTFSVVTCSYGLFCMPEATKALREAYRVLQPGGLLVIVVWAWPDTVQLSEVSSLALQYTVQMRPHMTSSAMIQLTPRQGHSTAYS